MSAIASQLPPPIAKYLSRFLWRRRAQRIVRAAGLAALLTIVWAMMWCAVDRLTALPATVRLAALCVNGAAVALLLARSMVEIVRRRDWIAVARQIELREKRWQERLWTVTSRMIGPVEYRGSAALLGALADVVSREAHAADAQRLLPWRRVARPWIVAVIVAIAAMSTAWSPALDSPRLLRRYVNPMAPIAPAATTRIVVTPGDVDVAQAQTLRVRASAQRLGESSLELHHRPAGQDWARQAMVKLADGNYEARVTDVERDIEYFVTGGDARSATYRAAILRRPAIAELRVRVSAPAYAGLAVKEKPVDDRVVVALVGSEAKLFIEATEPLAGASIVIGGAAVQTQETDRPNVRSATFTVRDDRRFTIRMISLRGVEGVFRGGSIRALADRPPVVLLRAAGGLTIDYQAADDLGLARLDLEVLADGKERALALPQPRGAREQQGTHVLDAAAMGLQVGDRVMLKMRAEDRAGHFAVSGGIEVVVPANAPAGSGVTVMAAPVEGASPVAPAGYAEDIKAYFQALKKK